MTVVRVQTAFNAAFLLEIKEDNRRLRELLSQATKCFAQPCYQHPASRLRILTELRDQLAMHFALENAYGYLADVVDYAPRLCERAHAMLAEHEELFREISHLVEDAESSFEGVPRSTAQRRLAWKFFEFRDHFLDHESRENELIMDAFDEDIGVGD
jgi:hypothetical protein